MSVKRTIKTALEKAFEYHGVAGWNKKADAARKGIEAERGKLRPKIKKQCREYAREVLGSAKYAPWLEVYSAFAGEFREGWMPATYYHMIVAHQMKGKYGQTSSLKAMSAKLLETDRLPNIAYYVNGLFFFPDWKVIPLQNIENHIFENNAKVIYKTDHSLQGKGVRIFYKKDFDTEKIREAGNGVFQKYIHQHELFEEFMPDSVATLRVDTVVEDSGAVSARGAFLRFGMRSDTHINSETSIIVPLHIETGKFFEKGILRNWRSVDRHPDTNVIFSGKTVPKFQEILTYCKKTHQAMPAVRSIGWDVTVDKNDDIQVMEWNGLHSIIHIHEMSQGPCFADLGWEKLWRTKSKKA